MSGGRRAPPTWPTWSGPLAYGQATKTAMRSFMGDSLGCDATRPAPRCFPRGPGASERFVVPRGAAPVGSVRAGLADGHHGLVGVRHVDAVVARQVVARLEARVTRAGAGMAGHLGH